MPSCNIILSFKSDRLDWVEEIPTSIPVYKRDTFLFGSFWRSLDARGGKCWRKYLALSGDNKDVLGSYLAVKDGIAEVILLTGSLGFDIAEQLVCVLHFAGYKEVDAIVYTDECDFVEDETGESCPMGARYFVDKRGRVRVEDYPQIEYEYY